MTCRHHDVQIFDGLRCCLACGETVFDSAPDLSLAPQSRSETPYQYARLNYALGQEIRLVVLFSGRSSDDIVFDIVHVNLTDQPVYEAVSYAWATQDGDASLSQIVYCRGRIIPVTKNCESALRCLRRTGRNRYLWIDAVCIDQENISERNHQVSFMGTIYSNASQVLIYLGPASDETDRVLDHLNGPAEAYCGTNRMTRSHDVYKFVQERWFDRVWILQEVALARLATLIAGDKAVQWTSVTIEKVLRLCIEVHCEPPSALRWLPASEPGTSTLEALQKSRNCSSTDPRDKVFALLGLVPEDFRSAFPVDYSLTVEEVFTKLAVFFIKDRKDLTVLKYVTGQRSYGISSWIPRWDTKVHFDPLPSQFTSSELATIASEWSFWPYPSDFDSSGQQDDIYNQLIKMMHPSEMAVSTSTWRYGLKFLWGKRFPTHSLSHHEREKIAFRFTQRHEPDFHSSIIGLDEASPGPKFPNRPVLRIRAHRLDVVRHILEERFWEDVYEGTIHPIFRDSVAGYARSCAKCESHLAQCRPHSSLRNAIIEDFVSELVHTQRRRKHLTAFVTNETMGFLQAKLEEPGCSVWALDGANVPFILGKYEDHYSIIGECYLHRAMKPHLCVCCGDEVGPWAMTTEIIDIW